MTTQTSIAGWNASTPGLETKVESPAEYVSRDGIVFRDYSTYGSRAAGLDSRWLVYDKKKNCVIGRTDDVCYVTLEEGRRLRDRIEELRKKALTKEMSVNQYVDTAVGLITYAREHSSYSGEGGMLLGIIMPTRLGEKMKFVWAGKDVKFSYHPEFEVETPRASLRDTQITKRKQKGKRKRAG